ncbi:MAG: penicillin-binding transpeptidase domain-containing protein [Solirubrobacteraceae bacterium]
MGGYYTPEDRRPPTTPQLSLRVAVLGFFALALFAIIFFRLWYLQVLAGDTYLAEANQNRARIVPIQAPRGDIVDRNGREIVTSRLANVVQIDPRSLPEAERSAAAEWGQRAGQMQTEWEAQFAKHNKKWRRKHRNDSVPLPPTPPMAPGLQERFAAIGKVVTMRPETIHETIIRSLAVLPYGAITLRVDVPRSMLDFLEERKDDYPGVLPDTLFLRKYPNTTLAAQLLGNVGEVSPEQLTESRFKGVRQGKIVGKTGVELSYDRYLRGKDGARRLSVNAQGQFEGELLRARRNPIAGNQVKLSLDLGLQRAGQEAIQQAISNVPAADAGAFVAMNPGTGEIYAMGSEPSFDPTLFTKPISVAKFKQLNSEENGAPLFNRAAQGVYPTGSTFKPITALAALAHGDITPSWTFNDQGCIHIGAQERCNAGHEAYGSVDLRNALRVSSDVYFYELGIMTNSEHTEVIQDMARNLGLGGTTGIDLPFESEGNVPDWKWREERSAVEAKCRKEKDIPLGPEYSVYAAAAAGCGISDMRTWSIGDNVSLAIGQGDVQATPLQMAVAYSTIAMDGRRPRPHLGLQIEDSEGRLVQQVEPGAAKRVDLDESDRQAVLDGLHAAAAEPGGTSYDVWAGGDQPWNQGRFPVYGKTGTAETFDHNIAYDQSWYVCWIKDTTKPDDPGIVIAVTVEKGGFGAEAAAPAARLIAAKWFKQGNKAEYVVGENRTR